MKTIKIEHSDKVPKADTPSKIANEVQLKNKSKVAFLFNSYAQWNCCIRGCFILSSKWKGLYFYVLQTCVVVNNLICSLMAFIIIINEIIYFIFMLFLYKHWDNYKYDTL